MYVPGGVDLAADGILPVPPAHPKSNRSKVAVTASIAFRTTFFRAPHKSTPIKPNCPNAHDAKRPPGALPPGNNLALVPAVLTVTFTLEECVPGVIELGTTRQGAKAGAPRHAKRIEVEKSPPTGLTFSWKVALPPGAKVALGLEALAMKSTPEPVRGTT